ncbi:DUF6776 family protein [Thiohalobacter sp.]|uniref:DUF6776 family protein n=1 Tax=Thiohalobacter sp. TaxID=2025948 RepID=UPI002629C75F|nr:DUF6776 family protein [Thiohalobacter sp.]
MDAHRTEVFVYRAWKLRMALALLAVLALVGGWQLYRMGGSHAEAELLRLGAERDRLAQELAAAHERLAEAERSLALLQRARQVDEAAYAEIRRDRAALEQQIHDLQKELTFYRGIMAPETSRIGLQAQGFVVEPIPGLENGYRFRLVLVQIKKNDRVASGRVRLAVTGQQGGAAKTLEQADISADASRDFKYRFRYFQNIQGEWRFPPGFVPERVTVKAIPSRRGADPLEWTFEWPAEHPQAPA